MRIKQQHILFVLISFSLKAFSLNNNNAFLLLNNCKLSIGYIYQKEHCFESGIKLDLQTDKSKLNFPSIIIGATGSRHEQINSLGIFESFRFLRVFNKQVGGFMSFSHNFRFYPSENIHLLTPEIGFNWMNILNFSYGYNLPLSSTNTSISSNRLAVRLMLR